MYVLMTAKSTGLGQKRSLLSIPSFSDEKPETQKS